VKFVAVSLEVDKRYRNMKKYMKKYKIRKNRSGIIVVVFLILLLVAYFLRNPDVLPVNKKAKLMFPGFKREEISRIEVKRSGNDADVLRMESGEWKVENPSASSGRDFPAEREAIESALDTIGNLEKGELVSKKKENHGNFGVGESGINVKLIGKERVFKFIVGSRGPGFGKSYIRKAREDKVYLVNESSDLIFGKGEWRDLKVKLKAQSSKLKIISITNENGIFEIAKEGDKWELVKPHEEKDIVQSRVEDLVSRLTNLEAADATTSAKLVETGLDKPIIRVDVKDGKSKSTLIIGNKNKQEQRFAQVSDNPYIYLLSPSDYGVLEEIDADYFRKENL
jgi:hypothetical protein